MHVCIFGPHDAAAFLVQTGQRLHASLNMFWQGMWTPQISGIAKESLVITTTLNTQASLPRHTQFRHTQRNESLDYAKRYSNNTVARGRGCALMMNVRIQQRKYEEEALRD